MREKRNEQPHPKAPEAKASVLTDADYDVIGQSILFQGMSRDELTALLPCLGEYKKTFAKESFILRAGGEISSVGLLLSGAAHIERCDYWGNRHIVSAIRPGDLCCSRQHHECECTGG